MRTLFISVISAISSVTLAQTNLVLNPSFEDTLRCPSDSAVTKAKVWFNPQSVNCSSPDFFYPTMQANLGCQEQYPGGWGGGSYYNNWGNQLPRTGVAYAGFGVAMGSELMAGKLSDSLKVGKTYVVKFYTSLADNYFTQGAEGLDLIGVCFMQDSITDYTSNCWQYLGTLTSDANNQSGNFLTDTSGWMLVQDTFIAEGGERYFVVGNIDTANTQYVNSATPTGCYYFFDDFDVHCIDCTSDTSDPPSYPEISLTPSITTGEITLSGNFPEGSRFELFNMLGQRVFYDEVPSGHQSRTMFLTLAEGAYTYRVVAAGSTLKSGEIVLTK